MKNHKQRNYKQRNLLYYYVKNKSIILIYKQWNNINLIYKQRNLLYYYVKKNQVQKKNPLLLYTKYLVLLVKLNFLIPSLLLKFFS